MTNVITIMKKELKSYWNSPIAYIFATVFLVLISWLFFESFFLEGQASLRGFFGLLPMAFVLFVPAVTMRLWAEEKKLGTIELLMTLPVKDHEVVLGKYLAAFLFLKITILLSLPLAIIVAALGSPDPGPIVGGYLGALFMGAAFLAIGIFVSGLTQNQIIALILAFLIAILLLLVDSSVVLSKVPAFLAPAFDFLGVRSHFESIERGVIDSRDLLYFASVIGFFLYLNVRTIESRKWA
jgi:ABC-2 type transport system permease protein